MNNRDFFYVAESRRSIRAYRSEPVPLPVLDRCLDAALMAPSSSNLQLWRFIVVDNLRIKTELAKACLQQDPAVTAPLLVALVSRHGRWREHRDRILQIAKTRGTETAGMRRYYRRLIPLYYIHGPLNCLGWAKPIISRVISLFRPFPKLLTSHGVRVTAQKSAALAAATFMLALRAEGYDSCPMEGFDPWRVRRLLKLKRGEEVCMLFAVGLRNTDEIPHERLLLPRQVTVQHL
jgi:nitroreductase